MLNQEVQNNQPTPAPTLPPAQNPGWMTQENPNDLSFLFNEESGQLEIVPKSQVQQIPQQVDEKFQAAVEQSTTASSAPGTVATIGQESQQLDPIAQRLSQMEQGFAQLVQYLQTQEQAKLNNLTPQVTQEQQPDYSSIDTSDPTSIVALINASVQNALKQYAQPMQQAVDQVKVKNNFDYTAAKYGQDFLNVLPKIQILIQNGILKSDPNTSFESLYLAFKQMDALNGNAAKSDSTIQTVNGSIPNRQPQTAQALVQKANNLSTESGGVQRSVINNERVKANNVEDAVNQAWNDLFGGKL